MLYIFTKHARTMLVERNINPDWIDRVLQAPALRQSDPTDETLERFFGKIEEADDCVLRVVVNIREIPVRIVSVFFDRAMRGRL